MALAAQSSLIAVDNFSRLPDELLIHILSFLRTNEAAVTSVLSSRWQHLWKLTGRIKICFNYFNRDEEDEWRRSHILNSVIYSFSDPISYPIHEISIRDGYFRLDVALGMENWISFILSRHRVRVLDLGLVLWQRICRFPPPSSRPRDYELMHLHLGSCVVSPNFQGFGNLRSISLFKCLVTETAFESINQNCTSLEHLKLKAIFGAKVLSISSALCNLKRLEILRCHHVRSLNIDSPNLAFLKYDGLVRPAGLYIRVPMLKEVALLCDPEEKISNTRYSPLALLQYCSRLGKEIQNLKLQLKPDIERHFDLSRPYPLNHIKELSFRMVSEDLTGLDALLRACSSLESFSFAFGVHRGYWLVLPPAGIRHESLQKIQIMRFHCRPDNVWLLRYLINIAVNLVEMEITVSPNCNDNVTIVKDYIKEEIEDNLPSGAKLVILPARMLEDW